jgi:predicted RecB family nuclease
VVEQEMMVGSKEWGFAGRFDLLYYQNGQLVLGDLKTSKTVQPTHLVQLAAYRLALAECGYEYPVERMEVIWAKPDGSYQVVESKALAGDFLNILAAYRSYNEQQTYLKEAA